MTALGLAATVGGGFLRGRQQQQFYAAQQDANNNAYAMSKMARDQERERQDGFEGEQLERVDTTTDEMSRETFDADASAAASDFVNRLKTGDKLDVVSRAPDDAGADVSVKDTMNRALNNAASKSRARIQSMADLQGYSGAMGDRAIARRASGDFLSILGGKRAGSLGVAQQEQDIRPATVTPGSTLFADILSGAGGVATSAGGGLSFGSGGLSAPTSLIRPMPNPRY